MIALILSKRDNMGKAWPLAVFHPLHSGKMSEAEQTHSSKELLALFPKLCCLVSGKV